MVLQQAQHKLNTQQVIVKIYFNIDSTKQLAENNIKLKEDGIFWKNILKYGN